MSQLSTAAKLFSKLGPTARSWVPKVGRYAADAVGLGPDLYQTALGPGHAIGERIMAMGAIPPALGFGASLVGPPLEALHQTFTAQDRLDRSEGDEFLSRSMLLGIRMEAERKARQTAANAQILAQVDPALYTQLLAGRRLPRGAVVIGGRPRTDLLEQVATEMGSGAYDPPPSAEEEFYRSLT